MIDTIATRAVDQNEKVLTDLAKKIWENPETAFNEVKACEWTAEVLRNAGFEVETGYVGMPTAIRAVWGKGHPVIGFLGEYDALPGLSQKVSTEKEPVTPGAAGQGCGHNLLGAGAFGAALAVKEWLKDHPEAGRVVLFGCPSEEKGNGKTIMAREGVFDGLDAAFTWHPDTVNTVVSYSTLANVSVFFYFKGVTSHAAAAPEMGRSALDAAELMNVGCNYLREHIAEGSRLHYVYTHSGEKPNIVPSYAQVWYFVRARTRAALDEITQRVIQVAQGAAQMTDTRVESSFLVKGTHTLVNDHLSQLAFSCAQHLEAPHFSEDCVRFAEELHREIPQIEPQFDTHIPCPVAGTVEYETGSTDLSLVSHAVPTIELCVTCFAKNTPGHHWAITAQAGGEMGQCGTMFAAQWLALMGGRLVEDPCLLKQVQAEFQKRIADEEE